MPQCTFTRLSLAALATLVAVFILLYFLSTPPSRRGEDKFDPGGGDKLVPAVHLTAAIDHRHQPCDDFYSFTCGLLDQSGRLPPLHATTIANLRTLTSALMEGGSQGDPEPVAKGRLAFKRCMVAMGRLDGGLSDADGERLLLEKVRHYTALTGLRGFLPFLEESGVHNGSGTWPNSTQLALAVGWLGANGIDTLLPFELDRDWLDSSVYRLYFGVVSTTFQARFYSSEANMETFRRHLIPHWAKRKSHAKYHKTHAYTTMWSSDFLLR